jgi:hypothetical protein
MRYHRSDRMEEYGQVFRPSLIGRHEWLVSSGRDTAQSLGKGRRERERETEDRRESSVITLQSRLKLTENEEVVQAAVEVVGGLFPN